MERRTALGVRQEDAIALALKRSQNVLNAGRDRCEGRLHQEPWAIAKAEVWKLGRLISITLVIAISAPGRTSSPTPSLSRRLFSSSTSRVIVPASLR